VLNFRRLAVIGCGLMGGSFALAMRKAGVVQHIVGYNKSEVSTELARRLGVIDEGASSAAEAATDADLIVLGVPVAATEVTLKSIRERLSADVLIMDMGSTKRDVVDVARRVLRERLPCFVPAHPIAGKEVSGVEHADAELFQQRQVILTPVNQTRSDLLSKASELWGTIGAEVSTLSPEQHDTAFAAVSHFPHLLAFAYFNSVAKQPNADQFLALAGPGFRDFTRIAASDPTLWRDVLLANREEVLKQSQRLRQSLDAFEAALTSANAQAVESLISSAAQGRGRWRMGGGRGSR
jgi:prephenate dehydrogenase